MSQNYRKRFQHFGGEGWPKSQLDGESHFVALSVKGEVSLFGDWILRDRVWVAPSTGNERFVVGVKSPIHSLTGF
jgi:hypothetical protein